MPDTYEKPARNGIILYEACDWKKLKNQFILLFSLFLLLFLNLIIFFGTIHEFYYIILTNFYFYLRYF